MNIIRLSRSIVGQQEADAVSRLIVEDGYLGMGKEVELFERDIANYLSVDPADVTCVNSGTAALHLAIQAIAQPGNDILVPSLTFLASYQAISAVGATPISCEVRRDTFTIDLQDAERRLTENTVAIFPVHYASNPAGLEKTYAFAQKHRLRVVEDAAHAFGCTYQDKLIGSFGDIVCFSFDGIKNITSGEGGAIVTKDKAIQSLVKDARLLGVEKDTEKRYSGQRSWDFDVKAQGFRYHMSNIFAAIGRTQLARFDNEFAPVRRAYFEQYQKQLKDVPGLGFQKVDLSERFVPHIFPIRVLNGQRDALKVYLEKQGIQTGIHYKPNHLLTFYGGGKVSLPFTEQLYDELMTLPLHPGLRSQDINFICQQIRQAFLVEV